MDNDPVGIMEWDGDRTAITTWTVVLFGTFDLNTHHRTRKHAEAQARLLRKKLREWVDKNG